MLTKPTVALKQKTQIIFSNAYNDSLTIIFKPERQDNTFLAGIN